jgi:hypothetical protein
MKRRSGIAFAFLLVLENAAAQTNRSKPPIIDMHLHAFPADIPARTGMPQRLAGLQAATTDDELLHATLQAMNENNIVKAVVSGPLDYVNKWRSAAPDRFIASPLFPFPGMATLPAIPLLKRKYQSGEFGAMGEITGAWAGLAPDSETLKPYFALAEELDLPVGIHTGGIYAAARNHCCPDADSALGNPVLLHQMLARYPKLRLYLMHAGNLSFYQETIDLMRKYPHLHAELSLQNWMWPREKFQANLKRFVDAGLVDRLMFGSDQMVWPGAIGAGIANITSASFLTESQKQDILYNNAIRFLRLR